MKESSPNDLAIHSKVLELTSDLQDERDRAIARISEEGVPHFKLPAPYEELYQKLLVAKETAPG